MLEVEISKGHRALIDEEDYYKVVKYKWYFSKGYACTTVRDNKKHNIRMHNLIMNFDPNNSDKIVDHIDGNTLNNQKSNLRIATKKQNSTNKSKCKNCKSGFKGVDFIIGKFRASLSDNRNHIHLGLFSTAEEAAEAYDKAALFLWGEFARLNFPNKNYDLINYKLPDKKIKTSKHRGVRFRPERNKWHAYFYENGKQKNLGLFETEELALQAVISYMSVNKTKEIEIVKK